MDTNVLNKMTYGLYLLSAKDTRDNACIINTAMQVANSPTTIAISVSKQNLTCEMIEKSGRFNLSQLSTKADFPLFQRFGFQSGREIDKFDGFSNVARSQNGLYYLTASSCGFMSVEVTSKLDLSTHTMFFGTLTDGELLTDTQPCSYAFYHESIKPKPNAISNSEKSVWRCVVCGYEYEGSELPSDYVCPLCKHGAEDFEKVC